MDDFKKQSWHLNKGVQIADILGMLIIAAGLAAWVFAIERYVVEVDGRVSSNGDRITAHETVTAVQVDFLNAQDSEIRREMNLHYEQISRQLERIQDTLNRHTENHQ